MAPFGSIDRWQLQLLPYLAKDFMGDHLHLKSWIHPCASIKVMLHSCQMQPGSQTLWWPSDWGHTSRSNIMDLSGAVPIDGSECGWKTALAVSLFQMKWKRLELICIVNCSSVGLTEGKPVTFVTQGKIHSFSYPVLQIRKKVATGLSLAMEKWLHLGHFFCKEFNWIALICTPNLTD